MRTGYLAFLINMMKAPDLAKADPVRLAAKYQVPVDWAAMSLRHWQGRKR